MEHKRGAKVVHILSFPLKQGCPNFFYLMVNTEMVNGDPHKQKASTSCVNM